MGGSELLEVRRQMVVIDKQTLMWSRHPFVLEFICCIISSPCVGMDLMTCLFLFKRMWQRWWVAFASLLCYIKLLIQQTRDSVAGFEEASCHPISGNVGEAHIVREWRWPLPAEGDFQQETKTLSPAAARK